MIPVKQFFCQVIGTLWELPGLNLQNAQYDNRFFLQFAVLSALAGTGIGIAKIATSLLALELQASAIQMGLIAGAQTAGILLMGMPVGMLIDEYGPLLLFLIGSITAGALYMLAPFLPSAEWLALVCMLISCFMPFRFVSLNAVFMRQIESVGVSRAGWFRGTNTIGVFLVGPGLAVTLVGVGGFTVTFGFIAATFFTAILLAPKVMRGYQGPDVKKGISFTIWLNQFALLRDHQELRNASFKEFSAQAIMQFYTFFIVIIALNEFGFGKEVAASLVTVQGLFFVLALFTSGNNLERWGEARFYLVSYLLVLVALTMLGTRYHIATLWTGGILLGLGLGMVQTANIARFAKMGFHLGRGTVAGITAFVGPAGGLVGSVLGGWLGQWLGLQKVFLVFLPVFLFFAWRQWLGRNVVPAAVTTAPFTKIQKMEEGV